MALRNKDKHLSKLAESEEYREVQKGLGNETALQANMEDVLLAHVWVARYKSH